MESEKPHVRRLLSTVFALLIVLQIASPEWCYCGQARAIEVVRTQPAHSCCLSAPASSCPYGSSSIGPHRPCCGKGGVLTPAVSGLTEGLADADEAKIESASRSLIEPAVLAALPAGQARRGRPPPWLGSNSDRPLYLMVRAWLI